MPTRLDLFDAKIGLDRGRSKPTEAVWYLIKCFFFLSPLPWPSGLKVKLLTLFGASIGKGVVIKPRVNIHFPWRLSIGNHSWLGEEVFILNLESVKIGSHSCISQRAFLCTGNHDYRDPRFSYRNKPISIGSGVWVGANVFICPGIEMSDDSIATAGSVITKSVPENTIVSGNPATPVGERWKNS